MLALFRYGLARAGSVETLTELYESGTRFAIALLTDHYEINDLAAKLEEIGASEGWRPGTAIADYVAGSCHLAAVRDGRIVGGVQVMLGSRCASFSFADIWPEVAPIDASVVAHVSVLALAKSDRGYDSPFLPLCGELWRLCREAGIREIWHEVTPPTLRLYRRMGWPLEVVGEERMHWGEPCYLARMGMADVARSLRAKARRSPSNAKLVAQASRAVVAQTPVLTAA